MRQLILVIEDETNIVNLINAILTSNNYQVISTKKGIEGISLAASHNPDTVLLDLGLPDLDGMDVIRRIREFSPMPIIVISAREHEREKVEALDLGADDYITKPFGNSELLARIRTALRHAEQRSPGNSGIPGIVNNGDLSIDFDKRIIRLRGKAVHFTPIEYKIVSLLAKHTGKVLTHEFIMKEIWGPYNNESQTLRVNMANIRRKIEKNPAEPEYIITEIGVGYRMIEHNNGWY